MLRRYKAACVPVGRSGGNNAGDDKRFLILTQERFHQRKHPPPHPHPQTPNSHLLPAHDAQERCLKCFTAPVNPSPTRSDWLRLPCGEPPARQELISSLHRGRKSFRATRLRAFGRMPNVRGKKNRSTRPKNNILKSRAGPSAYRGFHCLAKVKLRLNQRLVLHLRQI